MQAAILDAAAPLVAPGGQLVYMTCSLLRAENEDQVAAFVDRNPGWSLVGTRSTRR
jgi:16S rRNA (cytosine967-C5)-methyltransferase